MSRAAAFAVLLLAAVPVAAEQMQRSVEHTSCGALVADVAHELAGATISNAPVAVDLDARAWRLDEPAVYHRDGETLASEERYRVGDGAVRVRITLEPGAGRFAAELLPEPRGDFAAALAEYLPGLALPCRAEGRLALAPLAASGRDPADAAAAHRLLRRGTELLYDQKFAAADAALVAAEKHAPKSDTVRWMRARAAYLRGEALPADDRAGRLAAFESAEQLADEAVALAPDHGEGWLWRGIARGRITTTQAGVSRLLDVLHSERGPAWVAHCFERAIELKPEYAAFGFSAAGDARAGAAQLYRLLPDGALARRLLGVGRDLDRSVALAREAVSLQPQRIEYEKELGVSLLCRSAARPQDRAEAERVLRGVAALPARTPYERTDHRHAAELLASTPERACGYSRDSWDHGAFVAGVAP